MSDDKRTNPYESALIVDESDGEIGGMAVHYTEAPQAVNSA